MNWQNQLEVAALRHRNQFKHLYDNNSFEEEEAIDRIDRARDMNLTGRSK